VSDICNSKTWPVKVEHEVKLDRIESFFPMLFVPFGCVRFSFFSTKPRDWLGRTSVK